MDIVELENGVVIKLEGKENAKTPWEYDQRNEEELEKEGEIRMKRYRKIQVLRAQINQKGTVKDRLKHEEKKKGIVESFFSTFGFGSTNRGEIKNLEKDIGFFKSTLDEIEIKQAQEHRSKRERFAEHDPIFQSTKDIKINPFFKNLPIEAQEFESLTPRFYSHGFIDALHKAFMSHLPIEISPDNIWLLILQALAHHQEITNEIGEIFPFPENKTEIRIHADDFVKGAQDNDWVRIFDQFDSGIKERVPETLYNLLSNKSYSTTTRLDRICYTVTLMKTLQNFFDYSVDTMCGIFEIYLTGNVNDWEKLYANTKEIQKLGMKGLEDWFPVILGIIEHFIHVFEKKRMKDDTTFWRSIYKWDEQSGGPTITGWICAFFPYSINERTGELERSYWRTAVAKKKHWMDFFSYQVNEWGGAMDPSGVPSGICCVPFRWNYLGEELEYVFYTGFLGNCQSTEDTHILKPSVGYAVGEKVELKMEGKKDRVYRPFDEEEEKEILKEILEEKRKK